MPILVYRGYYANQPNVKWLEYKTIWPRNREKYLDLGGISVTAIVVRIFYVSMVPFAASCSFVLRIATGSIVDIAFNPFPRDYEHPANHVRRIDEFMKLGVTRWKARWSLTPRINTRVHCPPMLVSSERI